MRTSHSPEPRLRHLGTPFWTRFGALFFLSVFFFPITARSEPTIRYFGIFCDAYKGAGSAINQGVAIDKLLMDSLFTSNYSETSWGVQLDRQTVQGEEATKANIHLRIAELTAVLGPEDTVYVHFSGHGVILDPASGEQFLMDVNEEPISRKDLADSLNRLSCKLKILVTDCCSSYPESVLIAEGDDDVTPWKNVYSLLVEHTGFVNITAASPGQPAYGTQHGGFLTVNLHSDMQRFATWERVFQHTKQRVEEETLEIIEAERGATPSSFGGGILVKIDTKAAVRSGVDPTSLVQQPFAYSLGQATLVELPDRVSYVLPDSQTRVLNRSDLEKLDLQQLYLARNEIFARHGYEFSSELLANYFSSMDWYRVRLGFKNPNLSATEGRNVELIKSVEAAKGGTFISSTPAMTADSLTNANAPFAEIFPHSSREVISRTAVQSLALMDLSIARNEIYARHGFSFSTPALRSYFSKMPGYRSSGSSAEPSFNTVEQHNLWTIRKIERLKGGAFKW